MRSLTALLLTSLSLVSIARAAVPATPRPATAPSTTAVATAPATVAAATFTRQQDVIYGRTHGTALTFDVFTPTANPNGAAVVLVVSGGWVSSHDAIGAVFANAFVRPFVEHGYTVFAVVPASQPKFTIPEIAANVDLAVRFIKANDARFRIDRERIGITGGSAGGHLSLLQAAKPTPVKSRLSLDPLERVSGRVQAAAVLFPPTDFLNYRAPGRNILDDPMLAPFRAAFDFREISPEQHKYVDVSRQRTNDILRDISPANFVDKHTPPTLIIHGDKDELVPLQQAELIIEKLKAAAVPHELLVKEGAGHGWAGFEEDLQRMAVWFDKHLASK